MLHSPKESWYSHTLRSGEAAKGVKNPPWPPMTAEPCGARVGAVREGGEGQRAACRPAQAVVGVDHRHEPARHQRRHLPQYGGLYEMYGGLYERLRCFPLAPGRGRPARAWRRRSGGCQRAGRCESWWEGRQGTGRRAEGTGRSSWWCPYPPCSHNYEPVQKVEDTPRFNRTAPVRATSKFHRSYSRITQSAVLVRLWYT
jgi:hypothetical protein